MYLSNTFHLWFSHGFKALLIEVDQTKCEELTGYRRGNIDVKKCFITHGADVDNSIQQSKFTSEQLVLLSVDIDSDDYHIFETLTSRFAVVVIETRTTDSVAFAMSDHHPRNQSASMFALAKLGERKGYTAVCNTGNLILVRDDLVPRLSYVPTSLDTLTLVNNDVERLQRINKYGDVTEAIQYLTDDYKQRHAGYLAKVAESD